MRARELLKDAKRRLTASGSPDPEADALWLLSDALRVHRGALPLRLDDEVGGQAVEWFEAALARRESGEPLQYVEGFAWFYGRKFSVDQRVLIPRSDTEALCEAALKRLKPGMRVLDLCTGSGILAITFQLEVPGLSVIGADVSPDALTVARENAKALGASVTWAQGDLFEAVSGAFDLIACNPPYLTGADMENLQPEVEREPRIALYGGADGLDFYRRIAKELPDRLNPGGWALFEVGMGQAEDVADMLKSLGATGIVKDLSGADRVVMIRVENPQAAFQREGSSARA
jgi:release factor glutamine methyltransferase